jgi:hypothetical protein
MPVTDSQLRDYLLGRTPDADADHLETRLLENDHLFERLQVAEAELFDDHASGRLPADERARFLARFGHERARLAFADALARKAAARSGGWNVRRWMPLAAAAALIVAVSSTLVWRNTSPSPTGTANQPPAPVPERATAPAVPNPEVRLTIGSTRAADRTPAVTVTEGAASVVVRIRLDPADAFDRYSVEVRSTADVVVWRGQDLIRTQHGGDSTIVGSIPAVALDTGMYEVAVRGLSAGGVPEVLGFATMRVTRDR